MLVGKDLYRDLLDALNSSRVLFLNSSIRRKNFDLISFNILLGHTIWQVMVP